MRLPGAPIGGFCVLPSRKLVGETLKTRQEKSEASRRCSAIFPWKKPRMEMEVIPPGTSVNPYEAYDILVKVREMADIMIPLHEPKFAAMETIE